MKRSLLKKIGKIALVANLLYLPIPIKNATFPEENISKKENYESVEEDRRKVIILDPGHGMGNRVKGLMDWGMIHPEYKEAEIVLDKAKRIKQEIDSAKYKVILTREDNISNCHIEQRAEIANKNNADMFISIHVNNYKGWKSISGSEVYWRYEKDKELAKILARNIEEISGIKNRLVIQGDYLVLDGVKCPAVLLEVGYIFNEDDKDKIINKSGVEKSIVKTIESYLN